MNKKRASNLEKVICGTCLILTSTLATIGFLKGYKYTSGKMTRFSTYIEKCVIRSYK